MSLPKPYYDENGITIYHGDCREILPHLPKVDMIFGDYVFLDTLLTHPLQWLPSQGGVAWFGKSLHGPGDAFLTYALLLTCWTGLDGSIWWSE